MDKSTQATYTDEKGRTRWRRNDEIADHLKQLYDYLVIGGYDESHAARYPRLAHTISRLPQCIDQLHAAGELRSIPGVGDIIADIISQLITTGSCRKMDLGDEFFVPPPRSVLELTEIPRLGAKTARALYQEHGIDSLAALASALAAGRLRGVKGIGPKMLATMREHLAAHDL